MTVPVVAAPAANATVVAPSTTAPTAQPRRLAARSAGRAVRPHRRDHAPSADSTGWFAANETHAAVPTTTAPNGTECVPASANDAAAQVAGPIRRATGPAAAAISSSSPRHPCSLTSRSERGRSRSPRIATTSDALTACGRGKSGHSHRSSGRWSRRWRRRTCRRGHRSRRRRSPSTRATPASLHTAGHRQFNRSTDRSRGAPPREPHQRWRCRRTGWCRRA